MNKRPTETGAAGVRMATLEQFAAYTGLGVGAARKVAELIGCKRKFAKTARYDLNRTDEAFDTLDPNQDVFEALVHYRDTVYSRKKRAE